MTSGALGWKDRLWSLLQTAQLSSRLPGTNVMGAREGFWDCHWLALVLLVAKPSHMGVDVDGLACRLHRPTTCGR
jgi:hypothetical protein